MAYKIAGTCPGSGRSVATRRPRRSWRNVVVSNDVPPRLLVEVVPLAHRRVLPSGVAAVLGRALLGRLGLGPRRRLGLELGLDLRRGLGLQCRVRAGGPRRLLLAVPAAAAPAACALPRGRGGPAAVLAALAEVAVRDVDYRRRVLLDRRLLLRFGGLVRGLRPRLGWSCGVRRGRGSGSGRLLLAV